MIKQCLPDPLNCPTVGGGQTYLIEKPLEFQNLLLVSLVVREEKWESRAGGADIAVVNITVTNVAVVNSTVMSAALRLFMEAEEQYEEVMGDKWLEQEEGQVLGEHVFPCLRTAEEVNLDVPSFTVRKKEKPICLDLTKDDEDSSGCFNLLLIEHSLYCPR